mgnify:CR=1 FL=1
MRSTRFWVLIVAAVLAVSLLAAAVVRLASPGGSVAEITVDGQVVERIDLDRVTEGYTFTVEDEWGSNTIQVEPGRIRVLEADCPDQVCVRQGWISDEVTPIVCLPHRLVIQVSGGTDAGVDALS